MSEANNTQVGGTHYRTHGKELQHWDLAVMYDWDPFQYQITKYVMRWKHKHATHEDRLRDLHKAAHFLQKYIEVAAQYGPVDPPPAPLTPPPDDDWQCEGYYGNMQNLYRCRHCGEMVKAPNTVDAAAFHGACAGVGYVNQG